MYYKYKYIHKMSNLTSDKTKTILYTRLNEYLRSHINDYVG